MKSLIKFLLYGALLFAVSPTMAHAQVHKVEISKQFHDLRPTAVDRQVIVIERAECEVLEVRNDDEPLLKFTRIT